MLTYTGHARCGIFSASSPASKKKEKRKICNIPYPEWYVTSICFTNDKLEAVFEQLNIVGANGTQPKETVTYSLYTLVVNPEISATKVGTPDCLPQGGVDELVSHYALSQ